MTQTKKLNQQSKKRRSANGAASLSFDRGNMRIKFPAAYAQKTWGSPQVYFYLGLHHSSEYPYNLGIAENLLNRINDDLKRGTVDTSLETYRKIVEQYKAYSPKSKENRPTNFFDFVGKLFQQETLSSVYSEYALYRKKRLAETTFLRQYWGTTKRIIDNCPQDLNRPSKIVNYIQNNHASSTAKRTLGILGNAIQWAQDNRIISRDIPNPYKHDASQIIVDKNNRIPETVQELEDEGEIDVKDLDVFSFPPDEVAAIIEAFDLWVARNTYNKTPWDLIIRFLFWTGCRHGECTALHWNDITSDCSKIYFRFSYSDRAEKQKRKKLKTAGKGADFRTFNCGPKLQELLLSIRPQGEFDKDTPVFCNRGGAYVSFSLFGLIWRGRNPEGHGDYPGIIPELMKEGKVKYYLPPYATRATFINTMLDMTEYSVRDIALLAGHSPVVLEKHYRDRKSRQEVIPVEL